MKVKEHVTIDSTEHLDESRSFWTTHFGFEPTMEMDGYVHLQLGADGPQLAFMRPEEGFGELSRSDGLLYCFEVEDVDAAHAELSGTRTPGLTAPEQKPWGARALTAQDPNGITVMVHGPMDPRP